MADTFAKIALIGNMEDVFFIMHRKTNTTGAVNGGVNKKQV